LFLIFTGLPCFIDVAGLQFYVFIRI